MNHLRTLYLFIVLIMTFTILLFVSTDQRFQYVDYDVYYIDELDKEKTFIFYCLDKDSKIQSIEMNYDIIEITDIFKLYNEKMNMIKIGYYSPLSSSVCVNNIEIKNNTLLINLDMISKDDDVLLLLECLALTYKQFGIKEITLFCGKTKLTKSLGN